MIECENQKAKSHIERLQQIRHNIMLTNSISRKELKKIINEISNIEDENYKHVLTEDFYPFSRVKTCIDITRMALLEKLSEII